MRGSVSVPGRVNLIGEHIDYHNLPVLPMAIQRRVTVAFESRMDGVVVAKSEDYPDRHFELADATPFAPGDWGNYLEAAVQMLLRRWPLGTGINARITSDLPPAAGLSSSSALLTAFALALLRVNGISPTIHDLIELLPEGEQFVGTRGGGMDHAAVLASRAGCALLVHFAPCKFEPIPIPPGWAFLIAHSLTVAEKSGPVKAEYNSRRTAGVNALKILGLDSYRAACNQAADGLPAAENAAFRHVIAESQRVAEAVTALRQNNIECFGRLLSASHTGLRDILRVSNPALDELVECAREAGALGARLTGAGFGGCAIILCKMNDRERVRSHLARSFYAGRTGFDPDNHLMVAEPSAGALPV
ncbi:MAG: hypothetical protein M3Y72_17585 [Acidobacteriota bacterium]|nr:hypothetical protein [Acidobacteriota bacterium]